MKKVFNILLIISIFLIALTGCSNQPVDEEEGYKKSLTYSNLADLSSQDEVKKAMESAGIASENIDSFFQNVNYYNNAIEGKSLVKDGFVTIDSLEPEYDQSAIEEMWNTKNSSQLFMDDDALENGSERLFNQEEQEKFKSLFSFIPTENTKDISVHLNKVKKDWKSKDIKFLNKDKASLISVFFHFGEDNYLFIGHAGVLISAEDGKLLFIEKLSFQEPYQVIKFGNRVELNDYLMNKYDVSWDQPTAKPFIMENDQLLEGYRENPNNLEP